jgi:hypothetical protein
VPRVNSHAARLTPREFYSAIRSRPISDAGIQPVCLAKSLLAHCAIGNTFALQSTSIMLRRGVRDAREVAMQQEAEITVNGTKLTDNESRMVWLALASFADILANQLFFKDDGAVLSDQYRADVAHILALIEGRAQHSQ